MFFIHIHTSIKYPGLFTKLFLLLPISVRVSYIVGVFSMTLIITLCLSYLPNVLGDMVKSSWSDHDFLFNILHPLCPGNPFQTNDSVLSVSVLEYDNVYPSSHS